MRKLLTLLVILAVAAPGCARNKKDDEYRNSVLSDLPFVYKMTVQQGNIITEEMVDQVQLGMNKSQVRYLYHLELQHHQHYICNNNQKFV